MDVPSEYLLYGLLPLIYLLLSVVTLRLQLFALASISAERPISKTYAVQLKTLVVLALAAFAALLGLLQLAEVLILGDGLIEDAHCDHLYLLFLFLDVLLFVLLRSAS